ncbi:AraC family transcriptional regulator [Amycolatopsis sp. NBRC 101858]|uniref:helix-turn-helix domain-containing protein n=1 Tax=Amycolatopsis sp. NBRC 101858 TaxID=3032200 RepID=UPI0024A5B1B2|nr:AraC family transcriptional regulator [Amycolatopsis sp. NBRC 101858]GLY40185.1 AraC family transcriptional regulator [Amycolatopsis sp. NBRC 101858]
MSEALTFDPGAAARVRLCSRRDNGWSSVLVRVLDNAEEAELDLPPVGDQTVVLVSRGTTTIESRHGKHWRRAGYRPGSIGLTAPGNPTRIRWCGTDRLQTTHVHLPGALIDRTALDLWGRDASRLGRPDALAVEDPVLASVVDALKAAALAGADELYAESAATFLAVHLLTRHAEAPRPREPGRDELRTRRAVRFIRENHHLPLTLGEMAAAAELSPFHFLRVFKAATGQTPYRFLTRVRVERACRHLERGDLSVTEIAQACGFATPSRFASAFRTQIGLSPSGYRTAVRHQQ